MHTTLLTDINYCIIVIAKKTLLQVVSINSNNMFKNVNTSNSELPVSLANTKTLSPHTLLKKLIYQLLYTSSTLVLFNGMSICM